MCGRTYLRRKPNGQQNRVTFRALPPGSCFLDRVRAANLVIGDGGIIIGLNPDDVNDNLHTELHGYEKQTKTFRVGRR